jgi:hypothetical protein
MYELWGGSGAFLKGILILLLCGEEAGSSSIF